MKLPIDGPRSEHVELASVTCLGLCVGLWIRAKTVDQTERGHAEWRALFVGLWPATLWLLADALRAREAAPPAGEGVEGMLRYHSTKRHWPAWLLRAPKF